MRWVYRNGELVEKHLAEPKGTSYVKGIISDSIPDMVHPANGKRYDSKSNFRKVTKAYGFQEVGNEKQVDRRRPVHQDFNRDVVEAVRKIKAGYRPGQSEGGFSGDGWQ